MAVSKTINAATPIPGTNGVTYGQARNVRRAYGAPLQPGTLLARNGAWQHKRVVTNVVYGGIADTPYGPRHIYTVTMQPLGQLFADGRMRPTVWGHKVVEQALELMDGEVHGYQLRGWFVVQPFTPTPAQANPQYAKPASPSKYVAAPTHALTGPGVPAVEAIPQPPQQSSAPKAPPKPPEAILADFLIPAIGAQ